MNFKNPFNNNIQNDSNYSKNIHNKYDFKLYDHYQKQKDNINEYNISNIKNTTDKEFAVIYQDYSSKIKPLNSSQNYISCSSEIFPSDEPTLSQLGIPITLSLSPISHNESEDSIPLINYGSNEIPRCKNKDCEAFLNPFVKFIESGEKWICNFCDKENDTEDYYFCDFDKNGERLDIDTKPELSCGSYEFVAKKSYYKKNKSPTRALFMFLLETSMSAINSGFLEACIEGIKDVVNNDNFYNENDVNISIITYDTNVCFYSYGEKFNQPQMLIVTDEPTFLPTSKINLIFNLEDDKDKILQILDLIQTTFNKNNINLKNHIKDSNKIFDALNGAYSLGKNLGGKIIIFSSSNIIGKLPNMNDGIDKNSTKEQIAYSCHDKKQMEVMGLNLTNENISVDLIISADTSIELLTLNQLCDFANGNIYLYKKFNIDLHYKNILNQIRRILSRPIIWEGLNKIRFSNGCRITNFITPLLILKNELFVFPTLDADQNYIFNIGYDKQNDNEKEIEKKENNNNFNNIKKTKDFLYIQSSLLYSYGNGKKRIRVHNLCLPISNNLKIIYESMSAEVIANYYIKLTIDKLYKTKNLVNSIIYTETQFRTFLDKVLLHLKKLPDNLYYLPYYMIGFFKNRLFCKNEIDKKYDIDLSNYLRIKFQKMHLKEVLSYIVPTIYYLNEMEKDNTICEYNKETGIIRLPSNISCSKNSLEEDGLYLIDIGYLLILYIRKKLNKTLLQKLFGVDDINLINMDLNEDNIFENKNDFKERLINIINYLRDEKSNFQNLIIVFENTKGEQLINGCMIEDNNCNWYPLSYEAFHKKYVEDSLNFSYGY